MHSHFVRGKRTMCQLVTRGSGAEDELGGLESSKDSTRLNNSALDILVERSSLEGETGRAGMMPLVETTMIFRPHSMVLGGASPSIVTTSNSGNSSGIESGVSEDGDNESQTKDNLYQLPMNKEFQFPWKLYEMLDRSETESFEYIVSWQPGDFCFKVHEPTLFATSILRRFFRQSKYKSFQRVN